MKPGSRALGIAESYTTDRSTLAGVVMTPDGDIDDFVFGTCTVGGTDATECLIDMVERLDREDVRTVIISGIALAWYNIVDLDALANTTDRPTIAITYEASDGLEDPIEEAFDANAAADRLARYHALPPRAPLSLNGSTVYVRSCGHSIEDAHRVVERFCPDEATRPAPLRVASLAARRLDAWRTTNAIPPD